MSRRLFAFLLSELNLIRVKCLKCGNVVEIKADELGTHFGISALCPLCGERFMCQSRDAAIYASRPSSSDQRMQAGYDSTFSPMPKSFRRMSMHSYLSN